MTSLPAWVNPVWLGPLVGLVGVALAVTFFILNRRARIGPRLVYHQRHVSLIGQAGAELPKELELTYNGLKVPRVSKTTMTMWNSGTASISGSDVMEEIRFLFRKGVQVLRTDIVARTREANQVEAELSREADNEVRLRFRYLDAGDGAEIEILHTGDAQTAAVEGTIRGLPEGPRDFGAVTSVLESLGGTRRFRIGALVIAGLLAVSMFLRVSGLEDTVIGSRPKWLEGLRSPIWLDLPTVALYVGGVIWLFWTTRRGYPPRLKDAMRRAGRDASLDFHGPYRR